MTLQFLLWNPSLTGPRAIGSIVVSIGSPVTGQTSLENLIGSGMYTSSLGVALHAVPIRHKERISFFMDQTPGAAGVLAAIAAARASADAFSWSARSWTAIGSVAISDSLSARS